LAREATDRAHANGRLGSTTEDGHMTRSVLIALLMLATPATNELELPPKVSQLFASRKWGSSVPRGFRLIALSNIADGCVAQARAKPGRDAEARACVQTALELARVELPDPAASPDGLFVTHYNLILGAADALGACPNEALHRQLTEIGRASCRERVS
jgi:hypothetical protein